MPPPPPPRRLPPPLPGASRPRSKPQYLAVGVGVLAVTCVIAAVLGVASLSNPTPRPESGSTPEPVAVQPVGSTTPDPVGVPPDRSPAAEPVPSPAAAPAPAPAPASAGGSAQDVIARVKRSVVLILALRPGEIGSGTGFVVGPGRIATCNHVVAEGGQLLVFVDGSRREARVVQADPTTDLAILECGGTLPPPLPLADSGQVRDGDEIAVTGYPVVAKLIELEYDPAPSTTRGTVSARRRREVRPGAYVEEIQIDAAINPGNSGGPVYSTRDGSVVGVASSKLVEEHGMGFAIASGVLQRLVGR